MNPAKRKTIKKVITAKVDDWLKTLPEELAKSIKNDVVVTGGCIVSLLTGNRINDFDVYFKTIESAKAIAEHYAEQSTSFVDVRIEKDCENIKGELEDRLVNYIQSEGVANENPDEVDESTEWIEQDPKEETDDEPKPKYRVQFISRNAITLSHSMQLITRFQGSVEEIHRNFDFVHATCSFEYGKNELTLPPKALESILSNELRYQGSLYPIATIFRVKKFISRGWRITAGELLKIMWQISEVNMTNREVMIDQLTGVDAAYMNMLINALGDTDEDRVNSSYVTTIIDRIFNGESNNADS